MSPFHFAELSSHASSPRGKRFTHFTAFGGYGTTTRLLVRAAPGFPSAFFHIQIMRNTSREKLLPFKLQRILDDVRDAACADDFIKNNNASVVSACCCALYGTVYARVGRETIYVICSSLKIEKSLCLYWNKKNVRWSSLLEKSRIRSESTDVASPATVILFNHCLNKNDSH